MMTHDGFYSIGPAVPHREFGNSVQLLAHPQVRCPSERNQYLHRRDHDSVIRNLANEAGDEYSRGSPECKATEGHLEAKIATGVAIEARYTEKEKVRIKMPSCSMQ
jgi:hypothetical protein